MSGARVHKHANRYPCYTPGDRGLPPRGKDSPKDLKRQKTSKNCRSIALQLSSKNKQVASLV